MTASDRQRWRGGDPGRDAKGLETQLDNPPARIRLIYESADRRFCLFEDANGHLTSVRASKLA